jgi:predicted PurR-regulated permease PerM
MGQTARKAAVTTLVVLSIVVGALALWKIKIVIASLFLAFTIAAAMRPGVEWLARRRIPRSFGVLLHYVALIGIIALFLWIVVPRALTQVQQAIGSVPTSTKELRHAANTSHGIKHEILVAIEKRLKNLPSGTKLIHPAVTVTKKAFEVIVGIFFVFAAGAYWIFERDRAVELVASLVGRSKRKRLRDTWTLIDQKLGAFVRGELILIVFVSTVLSFAFWLDGLPYWILLGVFAGVFEIVPVIGPLVAGALAIGVGFTVGWQTALGAGIAVLVLREFEDYVIAPRVLGHAVGLSPLVVLVAVTSTTLLLGGVYVLIAIPIASLLATLIDVLVRGEDPAAAEVPAVLFPAKDAETG